MNTLGPNKLGAIIGKVKHAFNITNNAGDKVTLHVTVDFSTSHDNDICNWLVSNRIIAGQRPWRGLSAIELNDLNGRTFIASDIGKKVKSREEQVNDLVNAGLPMALARFAVDNPEKFQDVIKGIDTTDKPVVEPIDDSLDEYLEDDNS